MSAGGPMAMAVLLAQVLNIQRERRRQRCEQFLTRAAQLEARAAALVAAGRDHKRDALALLATAQQSGAERDVWELRAFAATELAPHVSALRVLVGDFRAFISGACSVLQVPGGCITQAAAPVPPLSAAAVQGLDQQAVARLLLLRSKVILLDALLHERVWPALAASGNDGGGAGGGGAARLLHQVEDAVRALEPDPTAEEALARAERGRHRQRAVAQGAAAAA